MYFPASHFSPAMSRNSSALAAVRNVLQGPAAPGSAPGAWETISTGKHKTSGMLQRKSAGDSQQICVCVQPPSLGRCLMKQRGQYPPSRLLHLLQAQVPPKPV